MVAMDPKSVEQASATLRLHKNEFATSIKRVVYMSWLQSKDVNAVESKYRRIAKTALHDLRADPNEYFLSLAEGDALPDDQSSDNAAPFTS